VRIRDDLLGLEVAEIDHRDAGIGLVVDEEVLPVVVASGFRERGMMRVAPGDIMIGHAPVGHQLLVFLGAGRVPLPGLRREHGDHLEEAHRRHADHHDLPGMTARAEQEVLVHPPRGLVGLERGQDVGVGEVAGAGDRAHVGGGRRSRAGLHRQHGENHRAGRGGDDLRETIRWHRGAPPRYCAEPWARRYS
jgi:hypothetical protein